MVWKKKIKGTRHVSINNKNIKKKLGELIWPKNSDMSGRLTDVSNSEKKKKMKKLFPRDRYQDVVILF